MANIGFAERLVRILTERGELLAAAESCTGGLAADHIVRIPGASGVFWGSFVCYTEGAKQKMLGLPEEFIKSHGAVSQPVALAMAEGALEKSGASWAFSVTGLAGPGGGTEETPLGTVWIGLARREGQGLIGSEARLFHFSGSRRDIREAAASAALEALLTIIQSKK